MLSSVADFSTQRELQPSSRDIRESHQQDWLIHGQMLSNQRITLKAAIRAKEHSSYRQKWCWEPTCTPVSCHHHCPQNRPRARAWVWVQKWSKKAMAATYLRKLGIGSQPRSQHLGNKGSSGNMKTQWKPEEGSLSNENVKCLEPSG